MSVVPKITTSEAIGSDSGRFSGSLCSARRRATAAVPDGSIDHSDAISRVQRHTMKLLAAPQVATCHYSAAAV